MQAEKKRLFLILIIGILVCAAIAFFVARSRPVAVPDRSVLNGKSELQSAYDQAREYTGKISKNPQEVVNYVVAGNAWKLIADSVREPVWYRLSLEVYDQGIAATQSKNSLLLTNAGQIAEELGEFDKAKKYYQISIDLAPGDANYHLLYIKLLKNKYHASEQEVLRAYDIAMSRVVGGADLVSSRLQYLKSIGRYQDAIDDLELLYKNKIITSEQYAGEHAEIEQLKSTHK